MLAVWKSGSRSSKIWSWRLLLRPQWTQRVHILGETHFVFHLRKSTVLTTFLIIGQVKDHFWAFLRPLLSSKSLIFTQPAFEAQPLREASKHFWDIWMKWGSYLSLFFFQEQLRKLIFYNNWDFHNLFTFNILSGWPCINIFLQHIFLTFGWHCKFIKM